MAGGRTLAVRDDREPQREILRQRGLAPCPSNDSGPIPDRTMAVDDATAIESNVGVSGSVERIQRHRPPPASRVPNRRSRVCSSAGYTTTVGFTPEIISSGWPRAGDLGR